MEQAAEKNIYGLLSEFRPCIIGDALGNLKDVRYVPLYSCWLYGGAAFVVCGILAWLWYFKFRHGGRLRCRVGKCIGVTLLPSLVCFTIGYACSYYFGGPYAYENYQVPTESTDVLIWFSGSDDGAYFGDNYYRSYLEWGINRSALFNFNDMEAALAYARQLPDDCRIVVRGHSMGGASAMRFAQRFGREIALLDTRDATSWFGKRPQKPANVRLWRNVLPGVTELCASEKDHDGTNYWCGMNMANLFRLLGGAWGDCPDAVNVVLQNCDHREVGEWID